ALPVNLVLKEATMCSPMLLSVLSLSAQAVQPPQRPEKLLINVQFTQSARPWFIADNNTWSHIDGLPFDGITYNVPATWDTMRGEYDFTSADLDQQFEDVNFSFQNVDSNFVGVVVRRRTDTALQGDFFDDVAWDQTCAAVSRLAAEASRPKNQCIGVLFDNEEYFEQVWNYPDDVMLAAQHDLDSYRAKARQRGREFMDALVSVWPEAVVMSLHGPYLSAPERALPENAGVTLNQVGDPSEYELFLPFFVGMLDASLYPGQIVDGGEVYQLRNRAEFEFNYCWRKTAMSSSSVVPPEWSGAAWILGVGATYGIYPYSWPDPVTDPMTPAIFESVVTHAIESGDDYAWVFTEASRDFLVPGGIPAPWIDAVERGRLRADRVTRDRLSAFAWPILERLVWFSPAGLERLVGCR
ncbi:MAG: hypothetical protein AAF368_13020, partial [Planctomycetota bacterium]